MGNINIICIGSQKTCGVKTVLPYPSNNFTQGSFAGRHTKEFGTGLASSYIWVDSWCAQVPHTCLLKKKFHFKFFFIELK